MNAKCPNCGAPFSLPPEWSKLIDCPSCHTEFKPIDNRQIALEQRRKATDRILSHFESVKAPLARKISQALTTNTPVSGKGGYLGRESDIEDILNDAVDSGNTSLTDAMLKTFADVHDWYFCHKLIDRTPISEEAEEYVAHAAMAAPHLGGQSGDYFHLLTILVTKRKDVREWCMKTRQGETPNSILAENIELVLAGKA